MTEHYDGSQPEGWDEGLDGYDEQPDTPTQVAYPGKATARTIVQTGLAGALALGVVAPIVWSAVEDELARQGFTLPPQVVAVVATVIGALVAFAAILTRIMAIPQVNDWLRHVGLQAGPGKVEGH